MNSVDRYIRSLIEKSDGNNPETRNQIYLAARKAIQNLPPEKSKLAMDELFETVKNIEAEHVRIELETKQHSVSPPKTQRSAWKSAIRSITIPWTTIAALMAVVLVISFSSYLLLSQFQNPANGEFNTGSQTDQFQKLFAISRYDDLGMMATNAQGTNPPVVYDLGKTENLLKFKGEFALYSKEPLKIDRKSLYLVQLALKFNPADPNIILNSGFSAMDAESNTIKRAMALHTSKINPTSYRTDKDEYFFSKIITWDDLEEKLGLGGDVAEVRPMIIVSPSGKDTLTIIKSFSVDKLE